MKFVSEMQLIFNWFLLLFLFENVTPNINDLTVAVQKNGNSYEALCIISGNSTNLAIDWITAISNKRATTESKFVPNRNKNYGCDFSNSRNWCDQFQNIGLEWKFQSSLQSKLGPVLDYRWEKFETVYTDEQIMFPRSVLARNYEINYSIRGLEGHIFLCNSRSPTRSACYWIIINGWGGRSTAIRKCQENQIPSLKVKVFPTGTCTTLLQNNSESQNILDKSRWVHFTLQRTNDTILLYKFGDKKPILNYTDNESVLKATNLIISSRGGAYWKLHEYEYVFTTLEATTGLGPTPFGLYTNSFCASLFVNMCIGCKLIVTALQRNFNNITSIVYTSNKIEWQQIKINLTSVTENSINLRFTTMCEDCKDPFWAIDDFQICNENEIRTLNSYLQLQEIACQIVATSDQITYNGSISTTSSEVECPVGTFGNECQYKTSILRSTYNKYVICTKDSKEENICRCSPGYTGSDCQKECELNSYGPGCNGKCGFCKYPPCHHITGTCPLEECIFRYTGSKCKTSLMPVLNFPPTVVAIKHKSCTVQVLDSSYVGEPTPFYYKIQYKPRDNSTWTSLYPVSLNNAQPIEIRNLNISTDYYIRAVLILDDGNSFESESVPNVLITTTCDFVETKNVNLKVSNTSAVLTIKNNSESCRSNTYRIWLDDIIVVQSAPYTFYMRNLTPFTYYTLTIKNTNVNRSLILNLYTDGTSKFNNSKPSSKVLNITAFSNSTSITVSWDKPKTPNGIIGYYKVLYQHSYNLACNKSRSIHDKLPDIVTRGKTTTLKDLVPYSEYTIRVLPVTEVEGEIAIITAQTAPTDEPDDNELPIIKNVVVTHTSIQILLNRPNCTTEKGPLVVYLSCQCYNHWCSNKTDSLILKKIDYTHPLRFENLFSYTSYNIEIKISRSGRNSDGPKFSRNIITSPTVPNKIENIVVYSKNKTSVSARFPLPYPPTGVLVQYSVFYCHRTSSTCNAVEIPAKNCLLWPSLQCVTLHNLKPNATYNFSISGRNRHTAFGQESEFVAETIVGAPTEPLSLRAEWDDYYNLTLKWVHPSISNGMLTTFTFQILKTTSLCNQIEYPITEEKYSYIFTIQVDKSCYSSLLDIHAWANTIYKGDISSTHNILSPPVTPRFVNKPNIVNVTNSSIAVDLEGLTDFQSKSVMYIIMTSTSGENVHHEFHEQIWRKSGLSETSSSWIAAEYGYDFLDLTPKIVVLGNDIKFQSSHLGREIHNRVLSPETNYIISILLTNTFMNMERHTVYRTSTVTAEIMGGRSYTPLFGLLLLLIVPFIIWFIVKKLKKPKPISWSDMLDMINTQSPTVQHTDTIPLSTSRVKI